MKINAYLLIDSHGAVELRKKPPAPHLRQVAIRLAIEISDTWFHRAIPLVEIAVPDDHVLPPVTVETAPLEEIE
jgi:hypothetical protein